MGIQGLLPFLKKSSRPVNLAEFKGKTAAVDAYCWLHKGAFSCAEKLVKGEATDGYVIYVMKQVSLLLSFNIKPILVFDGCHLPAKEGTELKRRENREKNRRKAKELLREGKVKEARECFQRCVDVTPLMAHEVIKACRARNVDTIVAPYEADSQLAFFSHCGIADIVITEDSDLVLFGCDEIVFKIDNNGGGILVEKEKLHFSMNLPRNKFDFTKFRNMCILSGCDYLPSLHGIGLAKACRFFIATSNPDVFNNLCKVPSFLKMLHLDVTLEYRRGFMKAIDALLHQLVFDPVTRTLRPLTPYPGGVSYEDMPYCGPFVGHERALQIALGNIDVQTGEVIDYYDPLKSKRPELKSTGWHIRGTLVSSHPSIWNPNYQLAKASLDASAKEEEKLKESGIIMRGKECSVESPLFKRKRTAEVVKPEDISVSEDYLEGLYSSKRRKDTNEVYARFEEKSGTPEKINPVDEDVNEYTEDPDIVCGEAEVSPEVHQQIEQVSEVKTSISNQECSRNTPDSKTTSQGGESSQKHVPNPLRNPFAKRANMDLESRPKNKISSKFSALTKFSYLPQQRSTIVRSKYFRTTQNNGNVADANCQKENQTDLDITKESTQISDGSKEIPLPIEEVRKSSSTGSPLKLKNERASGPEPHLSGRTPSTIECDQQQRKSSFKWRGQLSFGSQRRVVTSAEDDTGFLTPPSSQGGVENSLDSEVRCEEESWREPVVESHLIANDLTPPRDDDTEPPLPSPKEGSGSRLSFLATPKCRVSGLRKSTTPSSGSKQRQLNLKEMFAFKKRVL